MYIHENNATIFFGKLLELKYPAALYFVLMISVMWINELNKNKQYYSLYKM